MGKSTDPDNRQLADLRNEFTGHRIWRSVRWDGRPGDWVASLRDPAAGIDPTVIHSDAAALRDALHEEGERAALRRELGL